MMIDFPLALKYIQSGLIKPRDKSEVSHLSKQLCDKVGSETLMDAVREEKISITDLFNCIFESSVDIPLCEASNSDEFIKAFGKVLAL